MCFEVGISGAVTSSVNTDSASIPAADDELGPLVGFAVYLGAMCALALYRLAGCARLCRRRWSRKLSPGAWAAMLFDLLGLALNMAASGMYLSYRATCAAFDPASWLSASLWELEGKKAESFLATIRNIDLVIKKESDLRIVYSLLLIWFVVKTIQLLDFHPATALVGRTVGKAWHDILNFIFVFAVILVLYGCVGTFLWSATSVYFSSLGRAINTLLFIAIGETGDVYLYVGKYRADQGELTAELIFFWSYIFVCQIILLSILLSILVEAYVRLQDEKRSSRTISLPTSLRISAVIAWHDAWHALTACCRCRTVQQQQGKRLQDKQELAGAFSLHTSSSVQEALAASRRSSLVELIREIAKMRDVAPTSAPAPVWKDLQARAEARTQLDAQWMRAQLRLVLSDSLTDRVIWLVRTRGDDERDLSDDTLSYREEDLTRIALGAILQGNRRTAKIERLIGKLLVSEKSGSARAALLERLCESGHEPEVRGHGQAGQAD